MIKVFDNVFSEEEKDQLEREFTQNFPWFLSTSQNHRSVEQHIYEKNKDENTIENATLTNFLFIENKQNSPYFGEAAKILEQFSIRTNTQIRRLHRIKANLDLRSTRTEDQYTTPHIDGDYAHLVMIYYVNNSDGCTILFDQDGRITHRVVPVRGNCLIFPGNIYHAAQPPTKNPTRIVINFNFA